jgi:thioredoxin reductase (NADPH)
MPAVESFDVVIIGGGPAGVSCSAELQDNFVRHALMERSQELGGQLPQIANRVRNFAGLLFENGTSLQNALIKTANSLNLPFRLNDEVIAVNLRQKTVKTRHSSLIAKAIVLATGARPRKLTVKQGARLSAHVFYGVEGNEAKFKGQPAIVIGGGDNALIDALWIAKNSPEVTLICRSQRLKARPDLIEDIEKASKIKVLANYEVEKLVGKSEIEAVEIRNMDTNEVRRLPTSLVVAQIGFAPNTELFAGQLDMTPKGAIKTNESMETSVAGVFAAGDLTFPSYWRISTAVGQGTVAARGAIDYLALLS